MADAPQQMEQCGNVVYLRLPLCTNPCPNTSWLKIMVNTALVVFYHFAKMHTLGQKNVNTDMASFLFLIGVAVWLSNINLEPRCLTFYRPLKWIYDVFAVTIFANFILDTIWKQIVLFLNIMVATAVKYLEESFLANYIYDWVDPENVICLPDIVAFSFILWVLYSFGLWCTVCDFIMRLYCSILCPAKDEVYIRISGIRKARC